MCFFLDVSDRSTKYDLFMMLRLGYIRPRGFYSSAKGKPTHYRHSEQPSVLDHSRNTIKHEMHEEDPGWKEHLASESEAIVKAERHEIDHDHEHEHEDIEEEKPSSGANITNTPLPGPNDEVKSQCLNNEVDHRDP